MSGTTNDKHEPIKYRPDIDGLRALAVLPVILFHLEPSWIPGGFVGVDIFFVISGFLITKIIWREAQEQRFTFARFYERRARRILPVLFTVLTVSSCLALWMMTPAELSSYSETLAGAALFASNIVLFFQTGYFDAAAHQKPLLHTWSLAVEEQFYIFFPIVILVSLKFLKVRFTLLLVVLGAVLSFLISLYVTNKDPSLSFYWLPFRAWELLFGSLIALGILPELRSRVLRHAVSVVGLVLVLVSLAFYSSGTLFPGLMAAPPVLGATMIIWSGPSSLIGRALSAKPLVFVGLISYSLYMWHWPIIVFAELYLIREPYLYELLAIFAVTVMVSYVSWRFIEQPFRNSEGLVKRTRSVAIASVSGIACAACASAFFFVSGGFPQRWSAELQQVAAVSEERPSCRSSDLIDTLGLNVMACHIGQLHGPLDFVLWGDSHAGSWLPLFDRMLREERLSGMVISAPGCVPALNLDRAESWRRCEFIERSLFEQVLELNVKKVVIVASWELHVADPEKNTIYDGRFSNDVFSRQFNIVGGLEDVILKLQAKQIDVGIFMSGVSADYDVPSSLFRNAVLSRDLDISSSTQRREERISPILGFAHEFADIVISVDTLFCDEQLCKVSVGGRPLYHDDNHPSEYMNELAYSQLQPQFFEFLYGDLISGSDAPQ